MLSPRGQTFRPRPRRTRPRPPPREGCPRGLVIVSHRNHVVYVTFLSDRKLLLAL